MKNPRKESMFELQQGINKETDEDNVREARLLGFI